MTGAEGCCFVAAARSAFAPLSAAYIARQQTKQAQERTKQTQTFVEGLIVIGLIGGAVLLLYCNAGRAGSLVIS
jgi:hypothetical protein